MVRPRCHTCIRAIGSLRSGPADRQTTPSIAADTDALYIAHVSTFVHRSLLNVNPRRFHRFGRLLKAPSLWTMLNVFSSANGGTRLNPCYMPTKMVPTGIEPALDSSLVIRCTLPDGVSPKSYCRTIIPTASIEIPDANDILSKPPITIPR